MTFLLHRIIEGLKVLERRMSPRAMVKAALCHRDTEGQFLMDAVRDAREALETIERDGDIE